MSHAASRSGGALACLALAMFAGPFPLGAQGKVELIPFVASYYPLASLTEFTQQVDDGAGGTFPVDFTFKQDNAPAFGGRLRLWVSTTLGLEGAGAYIPSGVTLEAQTRREDILVGSSESGSIFMGSARLLLRPARTNFYLLVGPAVVARGGDAWEGADGGDLTDFGGVVGFGVIAAVTPSLQLSFNAEAMLYASDPDGDFDIFESSFQPDVLVSVGIPISLAR